MVEEMIVVFDIKCQVVAEIKRRMRSVVCGGVKLDRPPSFMFLLICFSDNPGRLGKAGGRFRA